MPLNWKPQHPLSQTHLPPRRRSRLWRTFSRALASSCRPIIQQSRDMRGNHNLSYLIQAWRVVGEIVTMRFETRVPGNVMGIQVPTKAMGHLDQTVPIRMGHVDTRRFVNDNPSRCYIHQHNASISTNITWGTESRSCASPQSYSRASATMRFCVRASAMNSMSLCTQLMW